MARKHTVKKETKTDYNAKTGNISVVETEEHVITDDGAMPDDTPHTFMADDNDEEEDLMFLGTGSKKKFVVNPVMTDDDDGDGEPALIIRVDDDGFW
jgi:hypothetical protein